MNKINKAAQALGRLNRGKKKNLSKEERNKRRARMEELNEKRKVFDPRIKKR